MRRSHEALTLARQFSHPFTLAHALIYAAMLHKNRREEQLAQEGAEAGTALAREHGFAQWVPQGAILHGWHWPYKDVLRRAYARYVRS